MKRITITFVRRECSIGKETLATDSFNAVASLPWASEPIIEKITDDEVAISFIEPESKFFDFQDYCSQHGVTPKEWAGKRY